jgi:hypothetical protein
MLSSASTRAFRRVSARLACANEVRALGTATCRRQLLTSAFAHKPSATTAFQPRRNATSYATSKQTLPSERVRTAKAPSNADLEEAELDAEVLAPEQIELRVSDRAAEVRTLAS